MARDEGHRHHRSGTHAGWGLLITPVTIGVAASAFARGMPRFVAIRVEIGQFARRRVVRVALRMCRGCGWEVEVRGEAGRLSEFASCEASTGEDGLLQYDCGGLHRGVAAS